MSDCAARWQLRRNFRHKALLGRHYLDPWMYPLPPKNTVLLGYIFPLKLFPSTEIRYPWKTPRILRYWTSGFPWFSWYFCFLLYYTTVLLWLCNDYFSTQAKVFLIRGVKIQYSGQNHRFNQWVVEKLHTDCYYKNFWQRVFL